MKKQNYVLMTVFLILFWGGHILPGQNVSAIAGAIDTKLTESLDFFKEGKVSKGAGMLLDVVLLTRPRSSWPDGFVQHLNLARDHFNRGSYTEGVSYILLAKKILRSDNASQAKSDPPKISIIGVAFQAQILAAKNRFKDGQANDAVNLILGCLELLAPRS